MTTNYITANLNIAGSSFYPNGTATVNIVTNAGVKTQSTVACTAAGTCSDTIAVSSINGITTATNISVSVTDNIRSLTSNTVVIQVSNTVIAPAITSSTTSLNSYSQSSAISGSGFTPSGSVTVTLTTNSGVTTSLPLTATSGGAITTSIQTTLINGVYTASTVSIQATDMATNDVSNIIQEPVTTINVAPVITGPTGSIQLVTS